MSGVEPPRPEQETKAPGMPGWVKVFLIIGAVIVVAVIVLHLTVGGFNNHKH